MNLIVLKSLRISNKTFDDFPDLLTSDIIENLFSERIFGTRKAATHCVKKIQKWRRAPSVYGNILTKKKS